MIAGLIRELAFTLRAVISRKDAKGAKTRRHSFCQRVHRCNISYLCAFGPFALLRETMIYTDWQIGRLGDFLLEAPIPQHDGKRLIEIAAAGS